jgi:hypothetical protein
MSQTARFIAAGAALALVLSLAALMSASESQAIVTFEVDSTLDEPDAANDGECSSTPSGFCTLRAAIMQTNQMPGMDIINVPVGHYTLTIPGDGEDASETGDLDVLDDLKIDGASGFPIIDGDGIDRVLDIDPNGEDLDVEIYDVRITGGEAPFGEAGGGIDSGNVDTNLHIERAFFEANDASSLFGGGLRNVSNLTMIDVSFLDNIAGDGGGMTHISTASANLSNVTFIRNHAESDGGGLHIASGSVTLTDGEFTDNTAPDRGGGVFNEGSFAMTTGTLTNNLVGPGAPASISRIAGADLGEGGAIYNTVDATANIADVTMHDNTASYGGGVYNTGTFDLTYSTLSSNFANIDGGGILNSGLGFVDLRNDTVSGNEAVTNGGGIANYGDLVQMNNVTVTLNTADFDINGIGIGGGVFNDAVVTVDVAFSNTIIGNNNHPASSPDCAGTLFSEGYNLVGNTAGCVLTGYGSGNITGVGPNLIDLANNGGATLTHLPAAFSPVIDAGRPNTDIVANPCEVDDQRGVTRPRDGDSDSVPVCDIGAVEVQGGGPTATPFGTPTPVGTPTPTPSPTPSSTDTPSPTESASPTETAAPVQLLWADANCNSSIDPTDSLFVLRADAGLSVNQSDPCVPLGDVASFDGLQLMWGDFDCNGAMSPIDSLKILQYDSGFEPTQSSVDCPEFGAVVTLD